MTRRVQLSSYRIIANWPDAWIIRGEDIIEGGMIVGPLNLI